MTLRRVDDCPHSFRELAEVVLPGYMAELQHSMAAPRRMLDFAQTGLGVRTLVSEAGRDIDFPGCYVMLEEGKPFYVGISRKVFARLRQHVIADTHNSATLAYRMASAWTGHSMRRGDAMMDPDFQKEFIRARDRIRSLDVVYVEIENPLVLHIFEPYAALELGTSEWNTFETH